MTASYVFIAARPLSASYRRHVGAHHRQRVAGRQGCATNVAYRRDIASARDFLDEFVALP
jgi:hypothetical protein